MKLLIYLTACVFTTALSMPDQTWDAITKVEDRVDKLEKNINYKDVEDRVNGIQQNNDEMKQNNDEMEKRFNEMKQNYDEMQKSFDDMHRNYEDMAISVQTLEKKNDYLQTENSELRNQMQEIGAEASSSAVISFTAIMTSGQFVPGGDDIVSFDSAITNPGGHYNEMTYKFTCPVEGLYFFTFSLYSHHLVGDTDHEACAGSLVMDGTQIVEVYGRHYGINSEDIKQVSNSAVVLCAEDAEVYVTAPFTNVGIYGESGLPRTTFSGFIL